MSARNLAICVCFIFAVTFTACDKEKATEPPVKTDLPNKTESESMADGAAKSPTPEKQPEAQPQENNSPLDTPKNSLAHQMKLLAAGDVEKLKACFTERLRSSITAESVAKGKEELSSYTLDDLYASEERGEYKGSETCKVKMKNGRTLTTFMLEDGHWLADTVWFQ